MHETNKDNINMLYMIHFFNDFRPLDFHTIMILLNFKAH
jgi:hypothetical protein